MCPGTEQQPCAITWQCIILMFVVQFFRQKGMMEANGDKPDRKLSRREMKASSSKSASLPPGAVLMSHSGEGFFMKIRRCLKLRNKGKYDLSLAHPNPETDCKFVSASSHTNPSSPAREDDGISKLSASSSPTKVSRRRKSDKEEVMLIHRDKKDLPGVQLPCKLTEGMDSDILVVAVGEGRSKSADEAAAAVSPMDGRDEDKSIDDVFDDLDPDYETLDDIRRKVHSKVDGCNQSSTPTFPVSMRQPQVKIKTNSDLNGRDSGLGSPFTDSLSSSRDSQGQSVNCSVLSSSAGFAGTSDPAKESVSTAVFVDDTHLDTVDSNAMVTSSTSSQLISSCAFEDNDLYSNADVLIRKKSQKQSQSRISLSLPDQRSSELFVEQANSMRNSLTPADFLALMESENPAPLAPPPLPARNYSEEDIATEVKEDKSFCVSSIAAMTQSPKDASGNSESAETVCNSAGARPKTSSSSSSRQSALIEQGPVITMCSFEDDTHIDRTEALNFLPSNAQTMDTTLALTNSIYEDIPARYDAEQFKPQICSKSESKEEVGIIYMDDDPVPRDSCSQAGQRDNVMPENVMIVSASDSLYGNDSDYSDSFQGLIQSPVSDESQCHLLETASSPSTITEVDMVDGHISNLNHQGDLELQNSNPFTSQPGPSVEINIKEESSKTASCAITPTSTWSQNESVSSPTTSSPSSVSSSDTLNNLVHDPDDLEGKDMDPPVGPPIHISHQQLLKHMDARSRSEELSPETVHRSDSRNAAARNARSMEIPPSHLGEQEDECCASAMTTRRHSSKLNFCFTSLSSRPPPPPPHSLFVFCCLFIVLVVCVCVCVCVCVLFGG